jgi:hypothetical protein
VLFSAAGGTRRGDGDRPSAAAGSGGAREGRTGGGEAGTRSDVRDGAAVRPGVLGPSEERGERVVPAATGVTVGVTSTRALRGDVEPAATSDLRGDVGVAVSSSFLTAPAAGSSLPLRQPTTNGGKRENTHPAPTALRFSARRARISSRVRARASASLIFYVGPRPSQTLSKERCAEVAGATCWSL